MTSYALISFFIVATVALIAASPIDEQQPLECPANEKYYKCSLEVCYKSCGDLKSPPPCPALSADCYKPACECEKDYLRNSKGVCVPYVEC